MKQPKYLNILSSLHIHWYFAIFVSAFFILSQAARTLPGSKIIVSILMLSIFFSIIRRGLKNGAAKNTIPEIYLQAKEGRKFAPIALELAAIVAVNIAFWMTI